MPTVFSTMIKEPPKFLAKILVQRKWNQLEPKFSLAPEGFLESVLGHELPPDVNGFQKGLKYANNSSYRATVTFLETVAELCSVSTSEPGTLEWYYKQMASPESHQMLSDQFMTVLWAITRLEADQRKYGVQFIFTEMHNIRLMSQYMKMGRPVEMIKLMFGELIKDDPEYSYVGTNVLDHRKAKISAALLQTVFIKAHSDTGEGVALDSLLEEGTGELFAEHFDEIDDILHLMETRRVFDPNSLRELMSATGSRAVHSGYL